MSRLVLVTGGARSGKSRWAEERALACGGAPRYIATCTISDDEMRTRVERHQRDRATRGWRTVEEPLAVPSAVMAAPAGPLLVDCLTLWLSNLLHHASKSASSFHEDDAAQCGDELAAAARNRSQPVVVVTNEVGGGIVPMDPQARRFRDCAGRMNAALAAAADEVVLMVCGLPLSVKTDLPPAPGR